MITTSSGFSEPRSSATTLRDATSGSMCACILSVTTTGWPRSCMRWSIIASSIETAAKGIGRAVESYCVTPVCGCRISKGETDPEQRGDRAHPRRQHRAADTVDDRGAVIHVRRVEEDDLPAGLRGPGRELVAVAHDQDGRRDSLRRRADAPPQTQDRQRRAPRLDERERLLAPHPVRDHRPLAVHVLEPVAPHLGEHPVERALQSSASR